MPIASASHPVIGTPIPPVMNPNPRITPEVIPTRPGTSRCAITSVTDRLASQVKPKSAPVRNAHGPGSPT